MPLLIVCTGFAFVPDAASLPLTATNIALASVPSMPSQFVSSNAASGLSTAPGCTAGSRLLQSAGGREPSPSKSERAQALVPPSASRKNSDIAATVMVRRARLNTTDISRSFATVCLPMARLYGRAMSPWENLSRISVEARSAAACSQSVQASGPSWPFGASVSGVSQRTGRFHVAPEVRGIDILAGDRLVQPLGLAQGEDVGQQAAGD